MIEKIFIAVPHGFCAGVKRAVLILNKCLEKFPTPIYVNHEIVHNELLVEEFKKKGIIFEQNIEKIHDNSIFIFSAHGVSPIYHEKCKKRNIKIIDATCPLVLKVHKEAEYFAKKGYKVILIGNKNHQEVIGTAGVTKMNIIENAEDIKDLRDFENKKVVCLTQTTLSMDDTKNLITLLNKKIPHLEVRTGICYASQNRQNAVKKLAKLCDFIIVIGSQNSSNSKRLVEAAKSNGCKSILLENPQKIPKEIWSYNKVGITSGASVPEILLNQLIEKIKSKNNGLKIKEIICAEEKLTFPFPII